MNIGNIVQIDYCQAVALCGEDVPRDRFYFHDDAAFRVYVLIVHLNDGGQLEHQLFGIDCEKEEQ